jgi:uncharacterized repeat protein (TIGR04052 family)
MTMTKTTLIALSSAALLTACAGLSPSASTQDVNIQFAAEVNGAPFECGKSYSKVGSTGATITPTDFRMFVSEVHLIDAQGKAVPVALKQDSTWQLDNLALVDFENGSGPCRNGTSATNTSVRGTVPKGQYTGMRLTLGVPFERNHSDPTVSPAPLNTTAMFWTWQGGYKFVKFDIASSFSVHLGSTVCASPSRTQAPSACQNPNRVTVTFNQFNPNTQKVVADMGRVLAAANVETNAAGTSPGCMSFLKDADCPPVMNALGLAYEGKAATGPQQLLSVR